MIALSAIALSEPFATYSLIIWLAIASKSISWLALAAAINLPKASLLISSPAGAWLTTSSNDLVFSLEVVSTLSEMLVFEFCFCSPVEEVADCVEDLATLYTLGLVLIQSYQFIPLDSVPIINCWPSDSTK